MDPIADAMMDLDMTVSDTMGFIEMTREAVGALGTRFTRDGWIDGKVVAVTDDSYPRFIYVRTLKDNGGKGHDVHMPWIPTVTDILAGDWRRLRCRTAGPPSCW